MRPAEYFSIIQLSNSREALKNMGKKLEFCGALDIKGFHRFNERLS